MCGRYALYGPVARLEVAFGARFDEQAFTPRFNAAPLQWLPVIRARPDGARVAEAMRWGLVPGWAKDEAVAAHLINARVETLAEKPSFRAALRHRRCVVPVNGFYEWAAWPEGKQPFYVHAANDAPLGLAGLWERWTRPADGETLETFTIVTTTASEAVRPLHDRMPLILPPEEYGAWCDAGTSVDAVREMLAATSVTPLASHPVGRAVGNVRRDDAELMRPLAPGGGPGEPA